MIYTPIRHHERHKDGIFGALCTRDKRADIREQVDSALSTKRLTASFKGDFPPLTVGAKEEVDERQCVVLRSRSTRGETRVIPSESRAERTSLVRLVATPPATAPLRAS
jgi:hypothetical protein